MTAAGEIERARRALTARGAWIDRTGEVWLVRQGADRRRRPVLTLTAPVLRALQRDPGLAAREVGGWVLATSREAEAPGRLTAPDDLGAPGRLRNRGESPITWLARRRGRDGRPWLTPAQVMAAEMLRADFEASGMAGRLTMDWDAPPRDQTARGPASAPPGGAARRRVKAALAEVGPGLREMLEAVCFHGSALQAAERSLGLPSRAARGVLVQALTRLAAHYRLG